MALIRTLFRGFLNSMSNNWELRYQAGDAPWDKGRPHPELANYLTTHPLSGRVLVPGCGPGHDVRAIAASGAEVVGIDIAPSAIELSRQHPPVGNERYELADFFDLPPQYQAAFDWVWEHTCFCAIDPTLRACYAKSVVSVLKPEGHFLAMFYLNPDRDPDFEGPPFGVTEAELDQWFGEHFDLLRSWVPSQTHPGREGREQVRLYRKRAS